MKKRKKVVKMDFTTIMQFVDPALLLVIVVLFGIGKFLKLNPMFKQEWSIPYILLAISLILTPLYEGFVLGKGFAPAQLVLSVTQAVLVATVTVFFNESIKQVLNKRNDDNK